MQSSWSRREFVGAGIGAGAGFLLGMPGPLKSLSAAPGAGKKMLILGGTVFLGPQIVHAAQALGYEVTLFNRGKSNPDLFPDLEHLQGDRDQHELDTLKGRSWDVVVDTSGYVPDHVRAAAEILADHVELYLFVSTISVYKDTSGEMVGEGDPLETVEPDIVTQVKTIRESFPHYGAMKALCEQAAEEVMPGRALNIRPGLIVGPEDRSDRFTYWPARVQRGGEILAPGKLDGETQFVDVRDLGRWCAEMAHRRQAGTYNAVGFAGRLGMAELLYGCKVVLGADCRFTWVSEEFLLAKGVQPFTQMPLWLPASNRGHVDNRRAIEQGLGFRPVGETIRDTAVWHAQTRGADHRWRAGVTAEREAELLVQWHKEQG